MSKKERIYCLVVGITLLVGAVVIGNTPAPLVNSLALMGLGLVLVVVSMVSPNVIRPAQAGDSVIQQFDIVVLTKDRGAPEKAVLQGIVFSLASKASYGIVFARLECDKEFNMNVIRVGVNTHSLKTSNSAQTAVSNALDESKASLYAEDWINRGPVA